MAEISTFRGVRYTPDRAYEISNLISPPYDIISPQQRVSLHTASPYNYVRLVLGEERPGDNDSENRFSRAGEFLKDWLKDGVLFQDDHPALYRQRIEFELQGCKRTLTGLTVLVKLHDYEDNVILPHEKTLTGPKDDLARLLESAQANLDSVWLMYEDNGEAVSKALEKARWVPLIDKAVDASGVCYGLDACHDKATVNGLAQAMAAEQLIIADGHHRYETALSYCKAMNVTHPGMGDKPWQWVMATLVWADDPGLTVLPTHRVVRDLPEASLMSIPDKLADRFNITDAPQDKIHEALNKSSDSSFLWWDGKQARRFTPKQPVDALGAEILQQCVLAEVLGFDIAHLKTDPRIKYTSEINESIRLVDHEGYQGAFLLKPIAVRTITRYAREGRPMPQKSTFFYPKLASGLVLRVFALEG